MAKTAVIIGSGIGGLGAAAILGKAGYKVTVLEKNEQLGGRTGLLEVRTKAGKFRFDTGPSWYVMPDIFEHFFDILGEDIHDHLQLTKLDPSYRVFYKDTYRRIDIYSDLKRDLPAIEQIEPGAGRALKRYLEQAAYQYEIAKSRFMYRNYDSIRDLFTLEAILEARKLSLFSNVHQYTSRYFQTEAMQKLVQYPLVLLGASPYNAPALYNIMSHIDFNLGIHYPQGGIYQVVKALQKIGKKHGVTYRTNSEVMKINVEDDRAVSVTMTNGKELRADIIISDAGVHHTEQELFVEPYRSKSKSYWKSRTLAPSAFIMYLGVKGELPSLAHHNLLFSKDWRGNFDEIFGKPKWPTDPSLYVSNPSKTDPSVAPKGHENLLVFVPIAPGLDYDDQTLEQYGDRILQTIEQEMRMPALRQNIVCKQYFSVKDFVSRYHSYHGSALGLAHTLRQTAAFRPSNVSKKVQSLYYVGADTHPGIGIPTCLISAELLYKRLIGDASASPLQPEQISQ